ncbi:MAG: hypothetical protein LC803_07210 [Acidobacteria bacterium]|nr:hypothetical protein [Acidobacteriota bacterium]
MNISHSSSSNRRRVIAGASLVGLSVTFLSNTALRLMTEPAPPSQTTIAVVGFVAVLNAVLMTAATLGLAQLLRARADWAGLLGAASTLVGWAASTRISVLIQLDALLRAGVEGVPPSALESIFKAAPAMWVSVFPVGLFFPLGLITLGLALFWWRPVNSWLGLLLALGGVFFPLGRAVGIQWAIVASDITLATAFVGIGWQVLTRPGVWATTSSESEIADQSLLRELRAGA